MALLPEILDIIKFEYRSLPHGDKGRYLDEKAKQFNISARTLLRQVQPEAKKQVIKPKNEQLWEWAESIAVIKNRPPKEAGTISTEQAIKIAFENSLIPVEALSIDRGTYDRIMREKGYNKTKKITVRYQAGYANKVHHEDSSHSNNLCICGKVNGEYQMRLVKPNQGYKNKPTYEQLRVIVYAATDDHSGKLSCRYTIAKGENISDHVDFLINHAWQELGLPEMLMADQGVLKKGLASQHLIANLGIEFPESKPYAKEAHGKIERTWRSLWKSFELSLYAVDNWEKFRITLPELNARLQRYVEEYNSKPHRYEKDKSREDVWHNSLMQQGGKEVLPENAIEIMCSRIKRKITSDGMFQLDNTQYTVKGCYDEWAWVYKGFTNDKITVRSIKTRETFEAKPLKVLDFGEYSAVPETPYQKLVKESKNITITKTLYTEDKEPDNIERIPLKEAERPIINPMDTSCYSSIDKAMADFYNQTFGIITHTPERMAGVRDLIIKNGLSKKFVKETIERLKTGNKSKIG